MRFGIHARTLRQFICIVGCIVLDSCSVYKEDDNANQPTRYCLTVGLQTAYDENELLATLTSLNMHPQLIPGPDNVLPITKPKKVRIELQLKSNAQLQEIHDKLFTAGLGISYVNLQKE